MKKKRILVIDDEKDFLEMVKLNLEQAGDLEVKTESLAINGLHAALMFKPDLIFLDIIMPAMEGPDVFRQIKGHVDIKNTPVVFLTASVTKDEVSSQKGMIGGRPFIAKPSSVQELLDCINNNIPQPEVIPEDDPRL